jgi:hypothetical protein
MGLAPDQIVCSLKREEVRMNIQDCSDPPFLASTNCTSTGFRESRHRRTRGALAQVRSIPARMCFP